jgi:hypothetical protein
MVRFRFLLLAALLGGCTPRAEHTALMENIDHAVLLPKGALPFSRYARAYAKESPNRVRVVYFVPATCSEASVVCLPPQGMVAGERRWFDNVGLLPRATGGGCEWIDVSYNPDTHRAARAYCRA